MGLVVAEMPCHGSLEGVAARASVYKPRTYAVRLHCMQTERGAI
jgi:hypothetical protein